jgi:hypothetical protein
MTELTKSLPDTYKLSWSAFVTYNTCPLSFYYSYILKEKSKTNIFALVGCALHELLSHIYQIQNFNGKYIYAKWPTFLTKEAKTKWKQYQYGHFTDKDLESAKFIGFGYLKKFLTTIEKYDLKKRPLFTELELKDSFYRKHPVVVKIDAGFNLNGLTTICDWKTGKPDSKYLYQLTFYSAIYQKAQNQIVDQIALVYFDHPIQISPVTSELKEKTQEYVSKAFDGIKSGNFPAKKHEYCSDCIVKLNNKCPIWNPQFHSSM